MGQRHEKLGIKQTIQKSWMDKTVQMMLAGMSEQDIRNELDQFLSTQLQSGGIGQRGAKTYGIAIGILSAWFSPEPELALLRDRALQLVRQTPTANWTPMHWSVIASAYPFWHNTARQVGRLLNLQDQVTQQQIFARLIEKYGDRETVARNARYTVRSFVAWNVLQDTKTRGSYIKNTPLKISNVAQGLLLLEAALLATPEGKGSLKSMMNDPAFFPFSLPMITGDLIAQQSNRLEVIRYGFDDFTVALK